MGIHEDFRRWNDEINAALRPILRRKRRRPRQPTTSEEFWAKRIARDRPDILDRMKAGEFKSVRAAAIEAGIVKAPTPLDIGDHPQSDQAILHERSAMDNQKKKPDSLFTIAVSWVVLAIVIAIVVGGVIAGVSGPYSDDWGVGAENQGLDY